MEIYLYRHGLSVYNQQGIFANRNDILGLCPEGREQVLASCSKLPPAVSALYSSPLLRARQTADILGEHLGKTYRIENSLIEFDVGECEGKHIEEYINEHDRLFENWFEGNLEARMAGGENLREIRERFFPFIKGLNSKYGPDETVVLVGHGGLFSTMAPMLAENLDNTPTMKHFLPNAGFIILNCTDSVFRCTKWGDRDIEI